MGKNLITLIADQPSWFLDILQRELECARESDELVDRTNLNYIMWLEDLIRGVYVAEPHLKKIHRQTEWRKLREQLDLCLDCGKSLEPEDGKRCSACVTRNRERLKKWTARTKGE